MMQETTYLSYFSLHQQQLQKESVTSLLIQNTIKPNIRCTATKFVTYVYLYLFWRITSLKSRIPLAYDGYLMNSGRRSIEIIPKNIKVFASYPEGVTKNKYADGL